MIAFGAFGKSSKESCFGIFLQHVLVNAEIVECPGVMGGQAATGQHSFLINKWQPCLLKAEKKSEFNTHSYE